MKILVELGSSNKFWKSRFDYQAGARASMHLDHGVQCLSLILTFLPFSKHCSIQNTPSHHFGWRTTIILIQDLSFYLQRRKCFLIFPISLGVKIFYLFSSLTLISYWVKFIIRTTLTLNVRKEMWSKYQCNPMVIDMPNKFFKVPDFYKCYALKKP